MTSEDMQIMLMEIMVKLNALEQVLSKKNIISADEMAEEMKSIVKTVIETMKTKTET